MTVEKCDVVGSKGSDSSFGIDSLKKYYQAISENKMKQTPPGVFGYGFNQSGQASVATGFQA